MSLLFMSIPAVGPGLKPRDGAEPTEPSDKTGSVLDRESVLNKESEGGIEGIGSFICKRGKEMIMGDRGKDT